MEALSGDLAEIGTLARAPAKHAPPRAVAPSDEDEVPELFGTETMAELHVRQGKVGEAIAIYRRLLAAGPPAEAGARWRSRLATLERPRAGAAAPPPAPAPLPSRSARAPRVAGATASRAPEAAATTADATTTVTEATPAPPVDAHRPPLVITEPVRSGQLVYAERNDLIVLAAVNPGARLVADGHIHVYGPMRGQAVAGARGYAEARVFCQRFEAELVAIGELHVTSEEIPAERRGKPAQIFVRDGRCVIAPL